jgi:N-acetylmuramoyl-L-alanine amidase
MRHPKPKATADCGRRRSRLLFAALVPLAFVLTWKQPPADPLTRPEGGPRGPAGTSPPPPAPRPDIVPRSAWRADESLVRERASTIRTVRVVFVHHTGQPNDYDCDEVPRMLRQLEAEHIARGWDDLGYNFIVDHCGRIYEGRSGALRRSVEGAHTKGFNARSLGIAALGTFDGPGGVPRPMLDSIAAVAAWKLRPGVDPRRTSELVSSSDESRFDKGDHARFHAITGHRDAYETDCPGDALTGRLGWIRDEAWRLRERTEQRRTSNGPAEANGSRDAGR